ncbi:hypothetical protein [Burkholderia sp. BCC1996]
MWRLFQYDAWRLRNLDECGAFNGLELFQSQLELLDPGLDDGVWSLA